MTEHRCSPLPVSLRLARPWDRESPPWLLPVLPAALCPPKSPTFPSPGLLFPPWGHGPQEFLSLLLAEYSPQGGSAATPQPKGTPQASCGGPTTAPSSPSPATPREQVYQRCHKAGASQPTRGHLHRGIQGCHSQPGHHHLVRPSPTQVLGQHVWTPHPY